MVEFGLLKIKCLSFDKPVSALSAVALGAGR